MWVYGALRVRDGQELTLTGSSRNTDGYLQLLEAVDAANPHGHVYVVTDNLSSHTSKRTMAWLAAHPRFTSVYTPKGACWLNLQEGWWRMFRREAFAGRTFSDAAEITHATEVATRELNRRATPWVWGRPKPTPRYRKRAYTYRF